MQQMNPGETEGTRYDPYNSYQGNPRYNDEFANFPGQKLGHDDEQFADLLARKIKQELKSELRSSRGPSAGQRLALAIVSLCLLIPLFALFVAALPFLQTSAGGATAFGWGIIAICVTIITVNAYFNKSIKSGDSGESRRNEKQ